MSNCYEKFFEVCVGHPPSGVPAQAGKPVPPVFSCLRVSHGPDATALSDTLGWAFPIAAAGCLRGLALGIAVPQPLSGPEL